MLISIPHGYRDCNAFCACRCDGEAGHDCFYYAEEAKLRGHCPPCFEAKFVDPARTVANELHNAFHRQMTALNGWRIKNEKSFDKVALLEERFKDGVEQGGPPWPRNRFGLDEVV